MQLFERIRELATRKGVPLSRIAEEVGASPSKFNQWLKEGSQKNLWEHLPKLLMLFPDVREEWLYIGKGTMLKAEEELCSMPKTNGYGPIPLVGFASCSTCGWHGTMTIPVSVEPPAWHSGMIAVMASGESMLPAGIGHGQVCYCDTTKEPGPGEAVYVELESGEGTIKLFLGRSAKGGQEEWFNLQGWMDKEPEKPVQTPFSLDVLVRAVRRIAPVIYVRRRL